MNCQHGINLKHKRCYHCEDIAEAEHRDDLSRTEATTDWYDHYEVEQNDFDRGDLRDEGRNPDGSGMSYGERNA